MDFFEKLWALDEPTKTKILIGATAIAMVIVVGLWYAYFNSIVIGASGQTAATNQQAGTAPAPAAAKSSAGPGIWQTIGGIFTGIANGLRNVIQSPRQYNIQPQH